MLDAAQARRGPRLDRRGGSPLFFFGRPLDALQAQPDLSFVGIHPQNLDLKFLARLDHVLRIVHLVVRQFRNVQQPFEASLQLDEHAEVRNLRHLALDDGAGHVLLRDPAFPRVLFELLQAQGHAFLVLVHAQDNAFDLVALLEHLGRMTDLLRPRHVGHVQEAVDALLDLDERPVVRQVLDHAFNDLAGRVLLFDQRPGIHLGLLDAEADLLLGLVDGQDHDLDLLADANHLGRVVDPLGPRHLADVHQPLDAFLEFDEGAVRGDVDDLARYLLADRVPRLDIVPRRGGFLLQAEGHLLLLAVDREDLDPDFLIDRDGFARMAHASPRHVGNVQETVDASQVHKRAEIGDVLDHAVAHLAHPHGQEQFALGLLALLLDQAAARDHDVTPVGVDLQNLAGDLPPEVLRHVRRATDVHLARRKEHRHADVHQQTALDLAADAALDHVALDVFAEDFLPALDAVGLPLRQDHQAAFVLHGLQQNIDLLPDFDLAALELFKRHAAFALEPHVDDGIVADDAHHAPLHHAA